MFIFFKMYIFFTFKYRLVFFNECAAVNAPLPKHVDMEKINRKVAQPLLTLCYI